MVDFTYYLSAVGYSWTLTPKPTLFIQGSNQEKVKVTIIAITFDGHPESVLAVVNDSVVDTNVGKGKEEDGSDVDDREEIPGVPSSLEAGLIYKSEFALLRRFICVRQVKFEGVHQYAELRRKFNIEGVHSYAERRNLQAKKWEWKPIQSN